MKKRIIVTALIAAVLLSSGSTCLPGPSVSAADQKEHRKESDTMNTTLGNTEGFLLANSNTAASIYIDTAHEEISEGDGNSYCGLELVANTFAGDVEKVTGTKPDVVTDESQISGNIIVAGTIEHNELLQRLVSNGIMDVSGLYKDGAPKWDCYRMQFISGEDMQKCGYAGVGQALVIAGSNKRGAMYGLFHISEQIGVSAWVYMADAVPVSYESVYLDPDLLAFNQGMIHLSKEPSVRYRGFFINDESPSFTGWAHTKFGGLNEKCYQNIFELLIRMKANYLWPAMWGNSFSDEGSSFPLANVVMADAYGVCMGTSHHEACCRAGIEWGKIFRKYGKNRAWDYDKNGEAIYKFWEDGIKRNGIYENTITLGMRGEADSALKGGVEYNIDLLKRIMTDQFQILNDYEQQNPDSKIKDAPKIYIPYSENEEYFYGPDDGSLAGLNAWEGMEDVTIMLTDDNYGNLRSVPEERIRNRKAGWGLYYHLDGHVGTGAYEWVSSTQLEHIWDQLGMAYEYNIRDIWVVNVGDIKPLEMELNYCMDLAYDMEKWGSMNTAETYRKEWLQKQLGGKAHCPDDVAEGVAGCVADFLKISTYRKPEYVSSDLYSVTNDNEAQEVLDLCFRTIEKADFYYNTYFKGTEWDDAYYQLVYYQAVATANVTKMHIFKSLSDFYAAQKSSLANVYHELVEACVEYDQKLTDYYNNEMSDKKWNKMMSSPHVGFVTWNSEGWSYPSGTAIDLPDDAGMIVSVDGDANGYETGDAALPDFTNTEKQRYCITLSNAGTKAYDFTVGSRADWIQITDKTGNTAIQGGTISKAGYVYISVDWTKVRSDKTGTVVIKGAGQTVKITVQTKYTDYKSKGIGTHFESNDVISIDAQNYSQKSDSENGVSWNCINGYGRYRSAMRMFPSTVSFTEKTGNTYEVTGGKTTRTVTEYHEPSNAPYMEYPFYVDEDGEYTFTAYTTTTNNISKPSGWGYVPVELFYGIQVDNGPIQMINSLPDGKYISYAADGDNNWIQGIKNNIHRSESRETISAGVHTVRFYGMHAGLGLERIAISNKELAASYLGPQATFRLDYDIIPEQKQGVHYEAAADNETLRYGTPANIDAITDSGDKNDPADSPETETPISRPSATPAPTEDPSSPAQTLLTASPSVSSEQQPSPISPQTVPTRKPKNELNRSGQYKVGKYKYRITKLTTKTGEVCLEAPVSKQMKKADIPASVKIRGITFKVTAISKKAFAQNKKLVSVRIGTNIRKIGAGAFRGCTGLKKITIQTKKLAAVGKNALSGIYKRAAISVPKACTKKYKKLLPAAKIKTTHQIKYSI